MTEWYVDLSEVDGIRKWYGEQPRLMRVASACLLNEFAFGTRTRAIQTIGEMMIVRNKRFVSSRLRVTKAKTSAPINIQESWTGSMATQRFSGWVEQEKGVPTNRNRFSTLAGRGGDEHKQMRPSIRLKPKHQVITQADYEPRGGPSNVGGFIAMALRKKETRLIRIKGVILKRKRSKLEVVQSLKRKQPRRLRWLRKARGLYFQHTDINRLWSRICNSLVKPPKK